MKPYLFWENSIPNKHILLYMWRERKTESLTFMEGHRLPFDTGNPNLSFTLKDPKDYDLIYDSEILPEVFLGKYDVWPNNGVAPVVNQRVVDVMNNLCPDQVQFFPIMLKNANSKMPVFANHDYFLMNICQTYNGVDMEKSTCTYFRDGDISGFNKLSFLESGHEQMPHIARLEMARSHIVVSSELVKAFKKAKIKGVKFIEGYDR